MSGNRKSILVNEKVHERLNRMALRHIGMTIKNNGDMIEHLMDFYENNKSEEVIMAMELIKKIKEKGAYKV
jgi:hypothetical protein